MFLIVRSFKRKDKTQRGIPIKEGDIIKIGRIELLITETKLGDGKINKLELDEEETLNPKFDQSDSIGET